MNLLVQFVLDWWWVFIWLIPGSISYALFIRFTIARDRAAAGIVGLETANAMQVAANPAGRMILSSYHDRMSWSAVSTSIFLTAFMVTLFIAYFTR